MEEQKMKKFLSFFLVAAVVATVSTTTIETTFAATTNTGNKFEQVITKLQANQQKLSHNKTAVEAKLEKLALKQNLNAFKQNLKENFQTVITNKETNLTALEQCNQLRITIAQTLESRKASGQKLSDDTKTQLKAYTAQIKDIINEINATKGQNKNLVEHNKTNIKNKDEAAINDTFEQIRTIQTARNDQIVKIIDILKQMNDLLK